ncbi:MAG: hypothetical protein O3A55_00875 [Bacteroidetes bacterium]|nr:hypothetical protein [Bacteroidota bacterium]
MFEIFFSFPTIIIFLFLIISVLISFYFYKGRFTLSKPLWFCLIILRSLVYFLLFILISNPVIKLTKEEFQKPSLDILVDNSQSMSVNFGKNTNQESFISSITNVVDRLKSNYNLTGYTFSNKITLSGFDSIDFFGSKTDITEAIKFSTSNNKSTNHNILIISDGNHNGIYEPLQIADNSGVQIYTLGAGDLNEKPDVVLQNVNSNTSGYNNIIIPIEFIVKNNGFGSRTVNADLFENDVLINSKKIKLPEGSFEVVSEAFQYLPKSEGIKKVTLKISPLKGEFTSKNNSHSQFINIRKTKVRVVLLSGSANPDVGVVQRAISNDPNIEVEQFYQKPNGDIYSTTNSNFQTSLSISDCLILVGFPTYNSKLEILNLIQEQINKNNISLFFIASRNIDYNLLGSMRHVLPFTTLTQKTEEVFLYPKITTDHFLLNSFDSQFINSDFGLYTLPNFFKTNSEATTLLDSRSTGVFGNSPLLMVRNIVNKKSIAFTSFGLWRWGLNQNVNQNNYFTEKFLLSLIRWLSNRETEKTFSASTNNLFFTQNEEINFKVEAYDYSYQPLNNLQIQISINRLGSNEHLSYTLAGGKNGVYTMVIQSLPVGDYYFRASTSDNKNIDSGRFSVGEESIEFANTTQNKILLEQISKSTGGAYFDFKNVDQLIDTLKIKSQQISSNKTIKTSQFDLKSYFIFLILLLSLLSLEWFLRKQNSML